MQIFNFRPIDHTSARRGFTLIEMMVSVSIFSVVMVVASGALITVINADRRARAQEAVLDNLDTALESMTRSIRVGSNYFCGTGVPKGKTQNCPSGATTFSFEPYGGDPNTTDQWVYSLQNGEITRSTEGGGNALPLTTESSGLTISNLEFYVTGAGSGDGLQPKVTVTVSGTAGYGANIVPFQVETTLSQRLYDI